MVGHISHTDILKSLYNVHSRTTTTHRSTYSSLTLSPFHTHRMKFINHMNRNVYGPNKTFSITMHPPECSSVNANANKCYYGWHSFIHSLSIRVVFYSITEILPFNCIEYTRFVWWMSAFLCVAVKCVCVCACMRARVVWGWRVVYSNRCWLLHRIALFCTSD